MLLANAQTVLDVGCRASPDCSAPFSRSVESRIPGTVPGRHRADRPDQVPDKSLNHRCSPGHACAGLGHWPGVWTPIPESRDGRFGSRTRTGPGWGRCPVRGLWSRSYDDGIFSENKYVIILAIVRGLFFYRDVQSCQACYVFLHRPSYSCQLTTPDTGNGFMELPGGYSLFTPVENHRLGFQWQDHIDRPCWNGTSLTNRLSAMTSSIANN